MSTTHVASAYVGLLISVQDAPSDLFGDDTEAVFRGYRIIRCDTRLLVVYQTLSVTSDQHTDKRPATMRNVFVDDLFRTAMGDLYHPDNVVLVAGYHNY